MKMISSKSQKAKKPPEAGAGVLALWPSYLYPRGVKKKKKNTHVHRYSFSGPENQDLIRS